MNEDSYVNRLAGDPPEEAAAKTRRRLGRLVGAVIVVVAIAAVVVTWIRVTYNPRTQDGSLGARYIGMAPEVEGRIVSLEVRDNDCVKAGQLLVEIDPRTYESSLQSALSNQAKLEEEIVQEKASIRAALDQVQATRETVQTSRLNVQKGTDSVREAADQITQARASLETAQANLTLADLTLKRNEPLAARNYISRQEFDKLLTSRKDAAESVRTAEAQVHVSEANKDSASTTQAQDVVSVRQSVDELRRSRNEIPVLGTLVSQRPAYQAAVDQARLNLSWTKVYAPFDGCIVSLNASPGEYAKTGTAMFTLIDENSWYVKADYGEEQLRFIRPGMRADVVLMTDPHHTLNGVVEGISTGVTSSDTSSIGGSPGMPGSLPTVQRSLDWVRLAARYPVRIHIQPRDPQLLLIGTTAEVSLHNK